MAPVVSAVRMASSSSAALNRPDELGMALSMSAVISLDTSLPMLDNMVAKGGRTSLATLRSEGLIYPIAKIPADRQFQRGFCVR